MNVQIQVDNEKLEGALHSRGTVERTRLGPKDSTFKLCASGIATNVQGEGIKKMGCRLLWAAKKRPGSLREKSTNACAAARGSEGGVQFALGVPGKERRIFLKSRLNHRNREKRSARK